MSQTTLWLTHQPKNSDLNTIVLKRILCPSDVEVLLNMLEFGMDPQQALDAPRIYVEYDRKGTLCTAAPQSVY